MEMVDGSRIKKMWEEPLRIRIGKYVKYGLQDAVTRKIVDRYKFETKECSSYDKCGRILANFGEGGVILTTSQMAWYCMSRWGVGEYSVTAVQKGYKGNIGIFRFTAFENHWELYPKMSGSLTANKRLRKDYAEEFKEIKEIEIKIRQARRNGESIEDYKRELKNLFELIEDGKDYYDDVIQEEKTFLKTKSGVFTKQRNKSGINPWLRNVFPIWGKHCYHNLGDFSIFPARGRIVEKDGVIGNVEKNVDNTDEMRNIVTRMSQEEVSPEESFDDEMKGMIGKINSVDEDSEGDGSEQDRILRRL